MTALAYRFPNVDLLAALRLALLCLAVIVAVVATVVVVNAVLPVIVAIAGKLIAGGAGTALFAFVFKPKGL